MPVENPENRHGEGASKSEPKQYGPKANAFSVLKDKIYIHKLPSYGNKIFYGLGFMALTCLALLVFSGIVLAFKGSNWWLANPWGIFFRSVHVWSVQAFFVILILHILVAFTTSAFKAPRRMVWVIGATIFFLVMIQSEFGYALRGDFSSQYRIISGADFWNGAFLGHLINPLNISQDFALHVAIIPIIILGLFVCHFLLVRTFGISKPYRSDIKYKMVPADHRKMYTRGAVLAVAIVIMALLFPSPFVSPVGISDIAKESPDLLGKTLAQEFSRTSGTATYLDSINPYNYDTRQVYVVEPYEAYVSSTGGKDYWAAFSAAPSTVQEAYAKDALNRFSAADEPEISVSSIQRGIGKEQRDSLSISNGSAEEAANNSPAASANNPVVAMINSLISMSKSGLYESEINRENPAINYTYSLNFLRDTGVLDAEASAVHITTEEWGMVREETGSLKRLPPGAWWFAPIGMLNSTILANDPNGDRDGAWILFGVVLLFILFPYIPYMNRIPEKLNIAPFIWK